MSVLVHVPGPLRDRANGAGTVRLEIAGGTIEDVLEALWRRHPAMRDFVVSEVGAVRPHVNVFVGTESIRWTGGLATAVPDGSEVSIVPAVSGG